LKFTSHILTPILDKHIDSIFHFKDFMPDHSVERVVPTGHIFLIIELDGIPRNTFDNETLKPDRSFTKAWISGMHTRYISISAHEKSEMFVVQFKSTGAYPFLHIPAYELKDKILPADKILGNDISRLRKRLLSAAASPEKFAAAEAWLNKRFDPKKEPPEELLTIQSQLQKEPVSKISNVIASYSNTQKHLINQFKKYIGLTPKTYQRILRFNEILQKIHNKQQITWTEIAYQCGYSDQSHFIKEFHRFSGFKPEEFIGREYHKEEPNFFPIDKGG
jgi:AraC-like DNA-binding protein